MSVYETVEAAVIKAEMELKRANIRGHITIELEPREWAHFGAEIDRRLIQIRGNLTENKEYVTLRGAMIRLRGPEGSL